MDVQDDRFEIEVVGWGEDKESWGIRYAVIYGDLKLKPVWEQLDEFLLQTFQRSDGAGLKIICTCVDSGGHFTNQVYRFCKARTARRVYAIKGKGGADVPYYNRPTTNNPVKCPLFTIGVDTGKSLLMDRLKVKLENDAEHAPGYCHFPREKDRGYSENYFTGLTAEKQVLTYKKGKAVYEWRIKDYQHKRNEALDCRNYATAALEIANPVLKKPDKENQNPPQRKRRGKRMGGINV